MQHDNLAEFGHTFQTKVISSLISDRGFLQQVSDLIEPQYFESQANNWVIWKCPKNFVYYIVSKSIHNKQKEKTMENKHQMPYNTWDGENMQLGTIGLNLQNIEESVNAVNELESNIPESGYIEWFTQIGDPSISESFMSILNSSSRTHSGLTRVYGSKLSSENRTSSTN